MKKSLNGKWLCDVDSDDVGREEEWYSSLLFSKRSTQSKEITVPGSFNTLEGYESYEGIFWYFTIFDLHQEINDKDIFIEFKGSNYYTEVWLNGEFIGQNEGGFVPFRLSIKNPAILKKEANLLAVRVDNIRRRDGIPGLFFDWFHWGGIYRDVNILWLEKNRIEKVKVKTRLPSRKKTVIQISYKEIGSVDLNWSVTEPDEESEDKAILSGSKAGVGEIEFVIDNPKLWSLETPQLYKLMFKSKDNKILYETTFGVREIKANGYCLYLNKKRIKIKGASLHEELMPYGRSYPYEERENDVKNMKLYGFNCLRTAHYSHDESLMEIADRLGLLILEEIPVWGICDFSNAKTFKLGAKMLKTLIDRDFNHPSVIWWSVGNEIPIEHRNCALFIRRLMDWVRMHDDTRLVTYVSNKFWIDTTHRKADIGCVNVYLGWYYARVNQLNLMAGAIRAQAPKKPWIWSEFGAGAKVGNKMGWKKQFKFSEERQVRVLDYTIRTLNAKDYMAGWFIWIYRDFRSISRSNEYQQGFNRKGIVSEKNEPKLITKLFPKIVNESRKVRDYPILTSLVRAFMFPLMWILTFLVDFCIEFFSGILFKRGEKKANLEREMK